jgi:hypothetical protein
MVTTSLVLIHWKTEMQGSSETPEDFYQITLLSVKSKSKVHPKTGHEGPEGEQMYSSTLPSTSALDGVGGQHHAPAALPTGKPSNLCTEGWVGPRAGLEGCGITRPHRDSIPGPSSP